MKGVAAPADMLECFRIKPRASKKGKKERTVKKNLRDRSDLLIQVIAVWFKIFFF